MSSEFNTSRDIGYSHSYTSRSIAMLESSKTATLVILTVVEEQ